MAHPSPDPRPVFESTADSEYLDFKHFRVGTCTGLWRDHGDEYQVLTINNVKTGLFALGAESLHNGHFMATLEHFEESAKRDGYGVSIMHVWNARLKSFLFLRGYFPTGKGEDERMLRRFA